MRAAHFVPAGAEYVLCSLRRVYGAIKRFHKVLWEAHIIDEKIKPPAEICRRLFVYALPGRTIKESDRAEALPLRGEI